MFLTTNKKNTSLIALLISVTVSSVAVSSILTTPVFAAIKASSTSEPLDIPLKQKELLARASAIHKKVITIDTHNDINPDNFIPDKNYTMDLDTQVTLPKMQQGGLDVSWLIVYTAQKNLDAAGYANAHEKAMDKFNAIHRLTETIAPKQIELALSSDDVRRISKSGKKVAMIGVENGYPLGGYSNTIKTFSTEIGSLISPFIPFKIFPFFGN